MDQYTTNLYGRVIAAELLIQGFMTMVASEQKAAPPAQFVADWEKSMKASLQHLERPLTDEADAMWGEAAKALTEVFSNVRKRVATLE